MVSRKVKNLLIIGCAEGIGKESLSFFSQKKIKIIALDLQKISSSKKIYPLQFDISNVLNHKKILKKLPDIDFVINFARAGLRKSIKDETVDNWDLAMNVNLKGPFFFLRELIKTNIKKKKPCNIINISSIASQFTTRESPTYHFSKAGVVMMTKIFTNEFGKNGIRVNSISPAFLLQKRYKKIYKKRNNKKFRNVIDFVNKTKEIGCTNDLFELCDFLMSDKSKFINGQNILLDGGSNSINPDPVAMLLNYEKI